MIRNIKNTFNLINEYGYGENASRSANVIGYVEGEMLSDSWNHSDDEMYFLTAPAFVNYAFDDKMKKTFEGCYLSLGN